MRPCRSRGARTALWRVKGLLPRRSDRPKVDISLKVALTCYCKISLRFSSNSVVETEPKLEDMLLLQDRIYEFNVQVTGVADGKLFACFLREARIELRWVAYPTGHGEVLATFATFSFPPICAIKDAVPL
jgi:hypothetical protein